MRNDELRMTQYNNEVVQDDLDVLYNSKIDWEQLRNKTILVTGATGMLASYFSFMLIYLNEKKDFNINILLLARNKVKAEDVFGPERSQIKFIIQDVSEKIDIEENIDYIFHAAGGASPYYIINDPVGIIKANILGTINVLELAKHKNTKKVLFTSTREIYGKVNNKENISELDMGIIDPLDSRSCYPESKRMAETILKSYSDQYKINFNTLRIAHTYGPGMQIINDGRVMADLIGDALNNKDIFLNSEGTAIRAFSYITDTIEATFKVVIDGADNEAYNIANENEPIKIVDLANMIQDLAGNNKTVKLPNKSTTTKGYTNYRRVKLDTSKLKSLEFEAKVSLKKGISRTLKSFR